jgi:SAM-dependent methyltransferase
MSTPPPHARCPVCDGAFVNLRHDWLFVCSTCGLLASNLEPNIPAHAGPSVVDEERRAQGLADIRARNNNIILQRILDATTAASRRLLDVGSGLGFFLTDAAARGFSVSGIEPDANVVEDTRKLGLHVRHGYFPDCLEPGETFDVIVFNDVLEHIPDLAGTLDACIRHLAPGGLLVVNCPNRRGAFYRIANVLDRAGIHGPFDRLWQRGVVSPHVWYFEPDDLRRLGERYGLALADQLDLMPITLRGISHRIFHVRNQSILIGAAAWLATLALMPFLTFLPRDICVVILRKTTE